LRELEATLAGPHPEGDRWCGRTVAQWLAALIAAAGAAQLALAVSILCDVPDDEGNP
jgi:hypothetical protein